VSQVNRRIALKAAGVGAAAGLIGNVGHGAAEAASPDAWRSGWDNTHDRVWLGAAFWANPMEDWVVRAGRAECLNGGGGRNIQLLTHQLENPQGAFVMTVQCGALDPQRRAGAGFRIGMRSDLNEYRSNCFAKNGWSAGIEDGQLLLAGKRQPLPEGADLSHLGLRLSGAPAGDRYALTLEVVDQQDGTSLGRLTQPLDADTILGNVALCSQFDTKVRQQVGSRFWFSNWTVEGDAFGYHPEQVFGPILWSMYSLSDSRSDEGWVLKLSALTPPLGEEDHQQVELQVERDGTWQSWGEAALDTDAWTATFRIPHWDASQSVPFRLRYPHHGKDGSVEIAEWTGTIRPNPEDRPLVIGGLTCQNDYAFPYAPVADNLLKVDPDLLYFSGDQLYENHGGFGIIRDPAERAILNYLRKYYQFGWSFREAMRDRPTLCIPDDHDVFQGNIWGEGGAPMVEGNTSSTGGYREPVRMVNVVHRTNTAHHPDLYDPTPVKQGMSVYYGDMVYGRVSFAIVGDRQFKSGPERVETGSGRADHVKDPDFDTAVLDKPGLVLLGERQEAFLEDWVQDWRGADMKVLLSETVFAGVATHHGSYDGYLKADLDSGGWPQTPRNRALRIIRKGFPLHINGDQHLTTLVQYGADAQRDGSWSFCPPAIAVGYPRWWRPDEVGMPHTNRPDHSLPHTGEYIDGFGNYAYVYAVGNPEVATKRNRYERAHQKGSGFGVITVDPEARTYRCDSYRFLVDPTDSDADNQFPGWPKTLQQSDNDGREVVGYLEEVFLEGIAHPVVKVFDAEGELVYALRSSTSRFRPFVFAPGTYRVEIGSPETNRWEQLERELPSS
jgi:hypothetical protein